MPLTRHERKDALGHGGQKRIADRLGVDAAFISRIVNTERTGARNERIEQAVADEIGRPVTDVFPPKEAAAAA